MTYSVAVSGASGYAGGEILRLLAAHPDIEIRTVTAHSNAGQPLIEHQPHLRSLAHLTLQDTNDVITGFTRGTDKIDLTAIDANAATGANDTFGFVAAAVSDVIVQASSVTWQQNGANVEVYADTDGDLTTAEFHITLLNVTGLSASDFDTL